MIKRNINKRGFTLIELIIVIAIIAILAAIAVPAFGKIRQKANVSSDIANARTIYSLVATELASDRLQSTMDITPLSSESLISTQIEPEPVVKTYQNYEFAYEITDGAIQIWAVEKTTSTREGENQPPTPTTPEQYKVYPAGTGKYANQ